MARCRYITILISQKHKSRDLESETLFFLQIKKFIYHTSTATLWQKIAL